MCRKSVTPTAPCTASCSTAPAEGKCRFPWDGIGLAHKRQLRFHRAVCKTAISPERCIIAPFILKGFGRCCVREHHAPSLQVPAQLPVDGTRFSAVPSLDRWSVLLDRLENFPAFRHECKDDARALSDLAPTSCVQESTPAACKSAAFALQHTVRVSAFPLLRSYACFLSNHGQNKSDHLFTVGRFCFSYLLCLILHYVNFNRR